MVTVDVAVATGLLVGVIIILGMVMHGWIQRPVAGRASEELRWVDNPIYPTLGNVSADRLMWLQRKG